MDPWSDIVQALVNLLAPLSAPPLAGVFIVLVNILLALISIFATRRFTDMEKMKADMAEVKAWNEKLKEARRTMDPILLQEVQEQQGRIMRLNSSMMTARCKPMCFFYIPFIAVFSILNALYAGTLVAVLPFNVQLAFPFLEGMIGAPVSGGFGLTFYAWYFLVGLGLGNLIRKPFGQSMTMS
ncbi:MAG: EMC3/TMCO1 family protein [Candidatus Thorarchaeota archaeon]